MRLGRLGIGCKRRLVFIRLCQDRQKLLKGCEVVAVHGGFDHRFHPVIPRNEGRIDRPHRGLARGGRLRLVTDPLPPAHRPVVIDGGVGK